MCSLTWRSNVKYRMITIQEMTAQLEMHKCVMAALHGAQSARECHCLARVRRF